MAATKATIVLTNGREIVVYEHKNGLSIYTEDGCAKVRRLKCDNSYTIIAIIPITQLAYVLLV